MKTTQTQLIRSVLFTAALAVAGSAFGQTPTCAAPGCNSITSDSYGNTGAGSSALASVDGASGGLYNTATGDAALANNTTGTYDTATGNAALLTNTTGSYNTATGTAALYYNTASNNTATGYSALGFNTTGTDNTATGYNALVYNTTGSRNNASGEGALANNSTANDNNAMGVNALTDNTVGTLNNAMGNYALEYNTTGNNNNAVGYGAMLHNTTGSDNSAQGYESLASNTTGNLNIAIGYKAGFSQTSGNQNIYLGNTGVAAESNVIRIGSSSGVSIQSAAFIAGISGNIQTGGTVVVTASGQLGVASSSRRYKQDIEPLGDVSDRIYDLRPVKFRYIKPDEQGQKPVQFGLIAEEVADVLPEVVYRNTEGKVEGVRYDELTPMLVALAQQQQAEIAALKQQYAEMLALKSEMQTELTELRARDTTVASR
jgi:trimeric autotransporter adhesin